MKGSEKQIKWAEDIIANLTRTYESAKALMPESEHPKMDKAIAKLASVDYAGDVIDAYRWANFTGDLNHDIGEVMACNHNMPVNLRSKLVPDIG